MSHTVKDFDLLDAKISIVNYRNLRYIDWTLMAITVALALVGFGVLYSATRSTTTPYYLRQVLFFFGGAGLALFIMCIDSRFIVWAAPALYGVIVVLLLAVLHWGVEVRGGTRWLSLGPFRLQPSEQSKLVLVFMLTWYLTTIKKRIRKFPYLLLGFVLVGVPVALILRQPNLGTASALLPIGVVMMYVAGCRWWHLLVLFLVGLAAVPFAYPHLEDHQKQRIASFLNPEAGAWQTEQSKITVGSGGLTGKGFGQGTQTMLNYLPEHHTDFIFSLLAEEHGFAGALVVIALFAVFLLRGLALARDCPDMTGTLLATGCVTLLSFHIFVNIAITTAIMPVTGIPLPFLSYGGNFYLTTMMCVGVLLHAPVRKHFFTD